MKHYLLILVALFLTATSAKAQTRISVHDPSVVDAGDGWYYIFGSHQAWAKTKDLYNWSEVSVNWGDKTTNEAFSTQQVTTVNVGGETKTFKNFDAKAWASTWPTNKKGDAAWGTIDGNLWAPDVIYNTSMNKWCMYLSINGARWNSAIILLTADNIEGPYTYQAPIVVSGFDSSQSTLDYKLTDLELAIGEQGTIPERYTKTAYWPHAIDPCVFYDEEGNLWMSYGSWLGGIWILQLDEETGLRDYNVADEYGSDISRQDRVSKDPYYGLKIAGGRGHSGEASYIKHIGDYYYLFVTYGGLVANGGYQMRVFRSSKPEGPYKDLKETEAIITSNTSTPNYGPGGMEIGENIFGAYGEWGNVAVGADGERSQGHNSVLVKDGQSFLVYHTRFQDRGEWHQVRVHQLFQNEDGWLCAAPFEYKGETAKDADIANSQAFSDDEIVGSYKVLIHRFGLNNEEKEIVTPINCFLKDDGSISGAATGSWQTQSGNSYITLTIDGTTYKGVLISQTIDGTQDQTICFSAVAESGVTVWGYQQPNTPTTTIGAENNSTNYWVAGFSSQPYIIEPNKTYHFQFKNYSSKANVWNGWYTLLSSSSNVWDFNNHYIRLRPDFYGWTESAGNTNENPSWLIANLNNSGFIWDDATSVNNFKENIDGATVDLTIKRLGNEVIIISDVTGTSFNYRHYFVMTCGDGSQDIYAFLCVDGSHLVIDNSKATVTDTETITGTLAGVEDNTGGLGIGERTDYTIKANETLTLQFINYTNRISVWNNWIIELQQNDNFLDMRADNGGWGFGGWNSTDYWNADNVVWNGYDWDTFLEDIDGAEVDIIIVRNGKNIKITAINTAISGKEFSKEYSFDVKDSEATADITARLITEGAHLDILSATTTTTTGISAINAEGTMQDAPMFDLSGRRVDAQYKGIVIRNGKKIILK